MEFEQINPVEEFYTLGSNLPIHSYYYVLSIKQLHIYLI